MKKIGVCCLLVLCLLLLSLPALADVPEIDVPAKSAVLIDAASGAILYEKDAHLQLPNASTTKIVTALLVLESGDLDRTVTVPTDFINAGESSIWLQPGETHTLRDLFYAMMLKSANDAAQVLAYAVAGSEELFVEQMNAKAAELGLENTHFTNCYGLHDDEHYTSAYDLAMLAREAAAYDFLNEVMVTPKYQLPWEIGEYDRVVYNGNKLLDIYEFADGMKNGYTTEAGSCLVGSATKDGRRLIAVVLNCSDMYNETAKLLEYGFENFTTKELCKAGEEIAEISVTNGKKGKVKVVTAEAASTVIPKDLVRLPEPVLDLPENIDAPVKAGTPVGTITYNDGRGNTQTVELLLDASVKRHSFPILWQQAWARVWQALAVVFA